ncbi:hypothetical protein V1260_03130 [Brachybacterium sp. J144]|uniref:hypothetical protein n=1 Tax=Brachybacterium sp. J144 TaxID=3116487 RepID=UPI002E761D1C|nr:hypothetical protein [Brachybacterium sp. J144]MEE1649775.1 hypothetical protein [Brachybacterium sp. J144]
MPGGTFAGWAAEVDLQLVELDTAAADERFGTQQGMLVRTDRFGTWWSPGFAEDSPVFTAAPVQIDPAAEEALGGSEALAGAATGVLVQSILHVLDTPLLLEADNSRSGEIASALVESLGLDEAFLPAFDDLFAENPIAGALVDGEGLPEQYGMEPLPYPEDGHRMHLLDAVTEVEMLELPELTGPLLLASSRGALPVETAEGERQLVCTATFGLALAVDGRRALMLFATGAAPSVHLEDPTALPVVAGTAVPEDWEEHTLRDLSVALPPGLGDPEVSEIALNFSAGERRATMARHRLPIPSPYPLAATRNVARAQIPGAELAAIEHGRGPGGRFSVGVTVHRGDEQFSVRLHDLADDESALFAHQLLAGLRLG